MLSKWILGRGHHGTKEENREKIAYLTGLSGLFVNLFLVAVKITVGLISGSVAILADGFNNIMDSASAVITILGVRFAGKPADREHPYGHGRIEYLTALLVSLLVIMVGLQFVGTSWERLTHPVPVQFSPLIAGLLVLSIFIKIWQSRLYKKVGAAIDSSPLKATGADALGDVLVTSVVLFSLIVDQFITYPLDGLAGLAVSLFIIYSGYSLIKETVSNLIGEAPSEEFLEELRQRVTADPMIRGVHDIIVHSFGPEETFVVLDAEFEYDRDLVSVHRVVDRIEREVAEAMGITLTIHVDPVGHLTEEEEQAKEALELWKKEKKGICAFHDVLIRQDGTLDVDIRIDGDVYPDMAKRREVKEEAIRMLGTHFPGRKISVNLALAMPGDER